MLKTFKRAGRRALRQVVTFPLRTISEERRGRILQELQSEMIVDVPVRDGVLHFTASSPALYRRAREALQKEPDTIQWIDGFSPGDVFWDVGANVGVFSLYAGSRPHVRVLSFEPLAQNYSALCMNITASSLTAKIVPYCVAFAGLTELGVLNSSSHDPGSSMHQFGATGEGSRYWKGATDYVQGMIGYTIDDFVAQFAPPFPTHLKLDVDGIELAILRGAGRTLRDPKLRTLMVELNLSDSDELGRAVSLLSEAGFACTMKGTHFLSGGETAANYFFSRK